MPETKAHEYASDGKLNELKDHLSSNPYDFHEADEAITTTNYYYYYYYYYNYCQMPTALY